MAVKSFVTLGAAISKLRAKNPELATALEQIQTYCDQMSQRVAELEKPIIADAIIAAAGAARGYVKVTIGNRQFLVQVYELI